jgi:hypothetical protein
MKKNLVIILVNSACACICLQLCIKVKDKTHLLALKTIKRQMLAQGNQHLDSVLVSQSVSQHLLELLSPQAGRDFIHVCMKCNITLFYKCSILLPPTETKMKCLISSQQPCIMMYLVSIYILNFNTQEEKTNKKRIFDSVTCTYFFF